MNDENVRLMLEQHHQSHQQIWLMFERVMELNLQFFNYQNTDKPIPQQIPDVVVPMEKEREEEDLGDSGITGGVN